MTIFRKYKLQGCYFLILQEKLHLNAVCLLRQYVDRRFSCIAYEINFKPTAEPRIIAIKSMRRHSFGSPNTNMPTSVLPTVPIPVHTAYAVPIGRVFIAKDNREKLVMKAANSTK